MDILWFIIGKLIGGKGKVDPSDATATTADILPPKTAYIADGKAEGAMPVQGAQTITPTASDQTIPAGRYLSGAQKIEGVTASNLSAGNIRKNVTVKVGTATDDDSVAEVTGEYEGEAPTLQDKTVAPSTSQQSVQKDSGYDGLGTVTVKAVAISNTLTAANVKKDVVIRVGDPDDPDSMAEVTGEYEGGGGSVLTPLSVNQNGTYTPSAGTDGFSSVVVAVASGSDDLDKLCQGAMTALVLASATSIRNYALYNDATLQSVSAAEALSVGQYAFQGCSALTGVSFPKATRIYSYAFQNLGNLALVAIPLCTRLDSYAFYNCQKARFASDELTAPYVDSYAMQNFGATAAEGFAWRPGATATAGSYAFAGSRVTEIDGDHVTTISSNAFDGAKWLEDADFSAAAVTSLGQYAFRGAGKDRADTSVPLLLDFHSARFTSVPQYAFADLRNTIVTLPSTVTQIQANAFNGMKDSAVLITGNLPTLANVSAFGGISDSFVCVPYNTLAAAKSAATWSGIADSIIGYAPAGTFTAGAALPLTNGESQAIYWSTDPAGAAWVTECPAGSPVLYARLGVKTGWWVDVDVTGATVSIVGSDSTVYPITDGRATLPDGVTFNINVSYPSGYETSITLDGAAVTVFPIENLSANKDYALNGVAYDPTAGGTWGASWTPGSSTKWTRTDDAANYEDPVPYLQGASTYGSPFDLHSPWKDMTVVDDAACGKLVKIKKFWYSLAIDANGKMDVKISSIPQTGYSVCPICADRGDGAGERDYAYIGRYHCASDYKSTSGVSPKVSITRAAARSGIHALGNNVWQSDWAARFTIWLLYIVEFADWNSQKCIGYGCAPSGQTSGVRTMGYTDAMPYHTGTTESARTTYGGTQYRNIEGLWDNCYDWADGCYYNSSGMNIILNPANFSDSSGGTSIGVPTSGWPSKFGRGEAGGLPFFYPTQSSGSASAGSCDYWNFGSSYPALCVGGNYNRSENRGLFCVYYASASVAYGDIGARLLKLP